MIVYSSIIGGTDKPREDDVLCLNEYDKFKRDVYNAKIYKILPHLYLDTDISMWIDGNIKLKVDPEVIVKEFLGDNDIALFRHFARNCVYREAIESKGRYKADTEEYVHKEIEAHAEHYKKLEYPESNGLYECNFLVRRHNKIMESFNEKWWAEICRHSNRDQISFPYVLSKFPDLKINVINGNVREHQYFEYKTH